MISSSAVGLPILLQVTIWSGLGLLILFALRRASPHRIVRASLAFLLGIALLSVLALFPWPAWLSEYWGPDASEKLAALHPSAPSDSGQAAVVPGLFNIPSAWGSWQRLIRFLPPEQDADSQRGAAIAWTSLISFGICLAAGLGLCRLVVALLAIRRCRSASRPIQDSFLCRLAERLARQIGIARPVALLESADLRVPATVGLFHPAILLPADWTAWTPADCRAVLVHELAHIRRRDYAALFLAQIVTAFYWYHPLIRGLARHLRSAQELAADALAVRMLGGCEHYLPTLCRLALRQDSAVLPAPARLFPATEISLTRRIAMLRDGSRRHEDTGPRWRRWLLAAVMVLAGLPIAGLRSGASADVPAPRGGKSNAPDWQRYLRPGASGVVVLSPSALFNLPGVRPLAQECNDRLGAVAFLSDAKGIGVPLEALECVVCVPELKARENGKPGTGSLSMAGLLIRMRTPADLSAFLNHNFQNVEDLKCEHGTYHISRSPSLFGPQGIRFIKPDERTVVFAHSSEQAQLWLSQKNKPAMSPAWSAIWPAETGCATIAFDLRYVKEVLKNDLHDSSFVHPILRAILTADGVAVVTVAAADRPRVECKLACGDEAAARKTKEQMEELIAAARPEFTQLLAAAGAASNPSERAAIELLSDLRIEQSGRDVLIRAASPTKLSEVLREILEALKAEVKVEKK